MFLKPTATINVQFACLDTNMGSETKLVPSILMTGANSKPTSTFESTNTSRGMALRISVQKPAPLVSSNISSLNTVTHPYTVQAALAGILICAVNLFVVSGGSIYASSTHVTYCQKIAFLDSSSQILFQFLSFNQSTKPT